MNERSTKELEQMQVKNTKLQQECEQLSSVKERLSLENQQNTNELKVHVCPLTHTDQQRHTFAYQVNIHAWLCYSREYLYVLVHAWFWMWMREGGKTEA